MCDILQLVPHTSVDEISYFIYKKEKEYDKRVQATKGQNFFKERECDIEDGFLVETFTYYKKYLFTKREVAKFKVYYNTTTKRATYSNLKFI